MTLSLAGIAVSLLTIAIVVASGGFRVAPRNFTATGNATVDDYVRFLLVRIIISRKTSSFLSSSSWASAQGQMGQLNPHGKMDEKLKSENMQKRAFFSTSECTVS